MRRHLPTSSHSQTTGSKYARAVVAYSAWNTGIPTFTTTTTAATLELKTGLQATKPPNSREICIYARSQKERINLSAGGAPRLAFSLFFCLIERGSSFEWRHKHCIAPIETSLFVHIENHTGCRFPPCLSPRQVFSARYVLLVPPLRSFHCFGASQSCTRIDDDSRTINYQRPKLSEVCRSDGETGDTTNNHEY